MRQKLRLAAPITIVAIVIAGVVLALTNPWGDSTAAGQTITYRACDVTVEGPPPPNLETILKTGYTPGTVLIHRTAYPPVLSVALPATKTTALTEESRVQINALTGDVQRELYKTAADEDLLSGIVGTARVNPLDPATAPWPYTDDTQVPVKRFKTENIEIRRPDPGAGLGIRAYYGRITIPREDPSFLIVENCRSRMWIGKTTGKVLEEMSDVHADDQAAFQRFLDDVNVGS